MDTELEQRIRERAYELWMRHGSLPGRADEYWYQAEREILGESQEGAGTQQEDLPIIDPAPSGMTSMTADEVLSAPAAPKARKKRSPAQPVAEEGSAVPAAPKRRRTTRVT